MAKIYTRTGDEGETGLIGGKRVSKASHRIETYGTIDELNSFLGAAISELESSPAKSQVHLLKTLQFGLFDLGSQLACPDDKLKANLPPIRQEQIKSMEDAIDEMSKELPPIKNFILPGGSKAATFLHICRTVCRRAERLVVGLAQEESVPSIVIIYLNRLSDYLFVVARYANFKSNISDTLWEKP